MPQGRRKTPFSGKAKKQQMQAKKQRKTRVLLTGNYSKEEEADQEAADFGRGIKKINKQPRDNTGKNRYALQFFQETKEELQKRKEDARKALEQCTIEQQEVSDDYFPTGLDMPKRPAWDFSMSKEELEAREQRYFTSYLKNIESLANISYFELNLETWRQLWRVIEMSDILLIIVDIRYPVMMFPPYLYNYVTNDLGKEMILILNKVDLAPAALVVAWQEYFKTKYPKLHILVFTSFPVYNLRQNYSEEGEGLKSRRRKGKLKMAAEGAQKIMETCKEIVGDKVDLTSWHEKIQEEMHLEYDLDDLERKDNVVIEKKDTSYFAHEKYKSGVLTVGCVGTPNVGKSSLINALMGKKVVSVSRTPGHTKHFQTIYLTKNVCLCDCPGLVFPSTVPKQFQILMGSFPIAQVREPYTTIKFMAERVDLPKLLKLQHQDNDDTWSAMDICDSWAAKRNYHTAKAARLDTYRAANSLLRMALEGKICVYAYPPNWSKEKERWESHPDIDTVKWIQARSRTDEDTYKYSERNDSSSDTEEDDVETNDEHETSEKDRSEDSEEDSSEHESQISSVSNKFGVLLADA
ncbi:guanine nucleotide-binding protein-like 1 isoform X1 [Nasonia vitripennis]|uniref:Guanine nucleotide-binding protein-like 1 n=2 Tax=Nasonia vitripennis TaxID=7425 RepID=A0A7M7H954_NASVI|nr:guanine nucleotide-binding protein-like 1 isoform X1 [Nasonia vitripennis]XP_016838494.1 guanine nucleotide-binding protein-like 1 isoform X1 [Nasonia vitripennis]